jgi:DHA2 family multidrug resistance protein
MCWRKARNDWFESQAIVFFSIAMVASARAVLLARLHARRADRRSRAFTNRNFAFGSLFSFVMGIGLYGLTYLYPVYLGRIRGYDALMIGETMFVTGLACSSPRRSPAILSTKMDPRVMMMIGFAASPPAPGWMTG